MIKIDLNRTCGAVKPLHGVNLGPLDGHGGRDYSQPFRKWRIPSVRVHDANLHMLDVVDLHTIFPNPHADPDDPANYVFTWTDDYLAAIGDVGAEIYFRLGESIEHQSRPRYIIGERWPSPEVLARVCVNIARHYNKGWANGFHWGIKYWEFWNEPNLPQCWIGTPDQFLEFYRAVSAAFRQQDPSWKIGLAGFALSRILYPKDVLGDQPSHEYRDMMLQAAAEKLPIDFVSWHCYSPGWEKLAWCIGNVRRFLDECGLNHAENHLTEWGWIPELSEGVNVFTALKAHDYATVSRCVNLAGSEQGAAYIFGALARFQYLPLDVAHYYTGVGGSWGLFEATGVPRQHQASFDLFTELLGGELLGLESDDKKEVTVLPVRIGDTIKVGVAHLNPKMKEVSIELESAGSIKPVGRQYTGTDWKEIQPVFAGHTLNIPLAGAGLSLVEWKLK